jgi:predicted lipoprotein with Yx(FWY)xxD motif
MRRNLRWAAAAALLATALAVTAQGTAASAATTSPAIVHSGGGLMQVRHTPAGTVLANPHGFTVYYYLADKPGSGRSVCTGSCAALWPAVIGPVRFPAGIKLPGKVGYITRAHGVRQLTIGGRPAYTFAGDSRPGQSNGQGFGGVWYVFKA